MSVQKELFYSFQTQCLMLNAMSFPVAEWCMWLLNSLSSPISRLPHPLTTCTSSVMPSFHTRSYSSSPCHCHLITCFSFTANGEDSANTNVLVLRLVRGIRVFRILRSFTTFAETQTMVDVMVYVVFASKWVMCVLVGFILCVCTLELNWFGWATFLYFIQCVATGSC